MRELSLEQIEGDAWGDAPAEASKLVASVHRLRRQPVGGLGAEELRVLIAQRVGLAVLLPRALELLADDPLTEGDYYPGDLLAAVLRVPGDYWAGRAGERDRLRAVLAAVEDGDLDQELRAAIGRARG